MGIRFYCPQGHKLNVKSFLAGKKGFCPHCNAKVDIPLTSTRASSRATSTEEVVDVTVDYDDVATHVEASDDTRAAESVAIETVAVDPVQMQSTEVVAAAPLVAGSAGQISPASDVEPFSPPAPFQSGVSAPLDPIAEMPGAVWYARPRTGGQYGPIGSDVLQQWIDEGRVAADTYVWREDWADWQLAQQVFPAFAAPSPADLSTPTAIPEVQLAEGGDPTAGEGESIAEKRLRRGRPIGLTLLVMSLSVIALALLGFMIYYVFLS